MLNLIKCICSNGIAHSSIFKNVSLERKYKSYNLPVTFPECPFSVPNSWFL